MLDILTFGDATLDVFLRISKEDAEVKCAIRSEDCQICFDFADKIPVENVTRVPAAGNASNNAVGSSRLGLKTAAVSILGDDDLGHAIAKYWRREGVSTRYVTFDKKRGTNYSTVLNYDGERTILVFHEKRSYRFPKGLPPSRWAYYTSLGKGSEAMHAALVSHVRRTGAKLCFQPGTFQLRLGAEALKPVVAAAEVCIMNKEEAERLVGTDSRSMRSLLRKLHALGCRIAVITDGAGGSYAYDGSAFLQMGIFDVPVIERTGCGDSYATALVAGLHQGVGLGEAMRWGTANAASVLGYVGPQKGLLTSAGMRKMLKRFKRVQPEKMLT